MIIKSIKKLDSNRIGQLKRLIANHYRSLNPDFPRILNIIDADEFIKKWLSEVTPLK